MIAIPNAEKPKSCYNHCLEGFIANEEIGCPLKDYAESHQYKDRIHTDCPLIEIVTCGECKYWHEGEWYDTCDKHIGHGFEAEHFCSYGKRKTDDHI